MSVSRKDEHRQLIGVAGRAGDDCQPVRNRRRIGITVKNDIVALRSKAIEQAIEDGEATDLNPPFVPTAHAARQPSGEHHAKRWWMS